MLIYFYLKIIEIIYSLFGFNYIEQLVIDKINFIYQDLSLQLNNENLSIQSIYSVKYNIYRNIKRKYNIYILNDEYKKFCINIYLIGNILKNNPKLTLKKDFVYLLYYNFKLSKLNNQSFYESFNLNSNMRNKYNSIIFNYNRCYDLLYIINNNEIYLKNIPNKDNINYGIKWCNIRKKLVFNYIY